MFYNYLNIAFRNLIKHKLHTTINVVGLALGMASVFLIALYIQGELNYDRFHHAPETLYRIVWENENAQTRTPHPMAQALVQDFPEVESAVSLTPLWAAGLTREMHSMRHPDKTERYDERNFLAVDTTFFKVFDFPLVKGNAATALKNTGSILLSESMARKYFGDADPIGKQLVIDEEYPIEIAGVFKDVPAHSHFHFDVLVSYLREKTLDPGDPFYEWGDFGHYNYLRLKPGTDAAQLEAKLMEWSKKYIDWTPQRFQYHISQNYGFKLQPVTDIHLNSRLQWELEANGNIEYVYILVAAALLTLIIACVNFMNLTTARSAERAREIGVRKTLGALRAQVSMQFLAESICIALLAVVFSLLIIEVSLPFFNYITGLSFRVDYSKHLPLLSGAGILIGALSGAYPSLYLSGVKPHLILKGKLMQTPKGANLRKGLIVFQFSVSMILISAAAIIFNQLNYLKNKNLGFGKDEVIVIPVKNEDGMEKSEALRNELLKVDGISLVSWASNIPGTQYDQNGISTVEAPHDKIDASEVWVDYDFFKTLNITFIEGGPFLRERPSDSRATFIINETAAKQLNLSYPAVGKEIIWDRDDHDRRGRVIGVVKDFHFQSLHTPIRPLLFALSSRAHNHILIKTSMADFDRKLAAIEKAYRQVEPVFEFEFSFMEDRLNKQYAAEERTGYILAVFSFTAIMIAAFGLFGMSMLAFQQRTKEVSIRKVLGASPINLLVLLLGGFTRLILVAVLIAVPFAWYIMDGWLDNFTYQVTIHPVTFVVAALLLMSISWITLSYFTVKATRLNPAETLRSE